MKTLGPMKAWVCTYYKDGRPYGITLYGTNPSQVVNDNKHLLPGLRIEGVLVKGIPWNG